MSEEDTFNKLKRLPLQDIVKRLQSIPSGDITGTEWAELRRKLLYENNYTLNEYYRELYAFGYSLVAVYE